MTTNDEMRQEVTSMLASLLAEAAADGSINIGDTGDTVKHVGYLDGDSEIWLRTAISGQVWIVRADRLNAWVPPVSNAANYRAEEVQASYKRYQALCTQWNTVKQVVDSMEGDRTMALQAWVEDVLSPDERECWFRWSSGGHATKDEWAIVR